MLRYGRSDVSIFFTEQLLHWASQWVNDNRKMMVNRWYPDIKWYERNRSKVHMEERFTFLDNGKTARNHNIFIEALKRMPEYIGCIVTDSKHIPTAYSKSLSNISLYMQERPDDRTMIKLAETCNVMVIPTIQNKSLPLMGPIGITSFMDALALGMPTVCPRSAAFAKEVEERGLGYTFEDDNIEDMCRAMRKSVKYKEEITKRIAEFVTTHNSEKYSSTTGMIIDELLR